MAQKPFISDMGIRLGDWLLTQNSDGDLTAGHVAVDPNNAQRAFRADYGVKIGNWEMYADGDELSVTENRAMVGSQRPFIADAGFQISDWTFTQDTDGNMLLSTTAIVSSGTETSGDTGSGDTDTVTAPADWSAATLTYTFDNPNAYGTSADDQFGYSVAVDGDYAIIGANLEDDAGGSEAGKAYIYNVSTGTLMHTLDGTSGGGDYFGISVGISGDRAIVGAYGEDDAGGIISGKAYIYNVTTGALVHTLDNPNAYAASQFDYFGTSVAISGDRAMAGAHGEDVVGGEGSGKAYIFDVTTGNLLHTLDNPNAFIGASTVDVFGWKLAMSGDRAIVSASYEDDAAGQNSGKAYIFDVTTGSLVHTLDNPNDFGAGSEDQFGESVAISGNYAIVGVPREDEAIGSTSGKAYIFDVTTGALVHTLDNPNAYGTPSSDYFGRSVSISGNYVIVGAYAEDDAGGSGSGKAYIFDVTTGALVKTLDNPNSYGTGENDRFGGAVAISDGRVIVGAEMEDDAGGTSSGKAYIFTAGAEPAIEMDPSSPDFDHTNFNWAITTSVDVPNPPTGMSSTAYENGEYAQVIEGDWHTWTVTTDAPDGTQIYMSTPMAFVGTYYGSGDPSNDSGISDKMGVAHGFKTVENGQITGSIGGYPDNYVENGELMQIRIRPDLNGTELARSQYIAIIDRP